MKVIMDYFIYENYYYLYNTNKSFLSNKKKITFLVIIRIAYIDYVMLKINFDS